MHTPYVPQQITVIRAQIYQGIPVEAVFASISRKKLTVLRVVYQMLLHAFDCEEVFSSFFHYTRGENDSGKNSWDCHKPKHDI